MIKILISLSIVLFINYFNHMHLLKEILNIKIYQIIIILLYSKITKIKIFLPFEKLTMYDETIKEILNINDISQVRTSCNYLYNNLKNIGAKEELNIIKD